MSLSNGLILQHNMEDTSADAGSIDFSQAGTGTISFVSDGGRDAVKMDANLHGSLHLASDLDLGAGGWTLSVWFKNIRPAVGNHNGTRELFHWWNGLMTGPWVRFCAIDHTGELYNTWPQPDGTGAVGYTGYNIDANITDSNWHLMTVVYDGSSVISYYIDGSYVGETSGWDGHSLLHEINGAPDNAWFISNVDSGGYKRTFAEYISDFRAWNRDLSSAEVEELFSAGLDVGMVAHYPLYEDVIDLVGDSDGTVSGASFGSIGGRDALSFDGVDDFVQIPDPAALSGDTWAISQWIKTSNASGRQDFFAKWYSSNGNYPSIGLGTDGGLLKAYYRGDNQGSVNIMTGPNVSDDAWHHIVYMKDSSTVRIYVDGTEVAQAAFSGVIPSTSDVFLGTWDGSILGYAKDQWFEGSLDDLRIWSRALSSTEVEELYNNGETPQGENNNMGQITFTFSGLLYDGWASEGTWRLMQGATVWDSGTLADLGLVAGDALVITADNVPTDNIAGGVPIRLEVSDVMSGGMGDGMFQPLGAGNLLTMVGTGAGGVSSSQTFTFSEADSRILENTNYSADTYGFYVQWYSSGMDNSWGNTGDYSTGQLPTDGSVVTWHNEIVAANPPPAPDQGEGEGEGGGAVVVARTRINHDQLSMPSHDEYAADLDGVFATPALAAEAGAGVGSLYVEGLPLEYVGVDINDYADVPMTTIVNEGRMQDVSGALETQIYNEMVRASGAEAELQGNIDTVASDLASYEGDNDAALQVERSRIDALLSGSSVDLDQLVELVAAYENADSDIISTITAIQGANAADEQALADHVAAYNTKMGLLDAEDVQIRSDFAEADAEVQGNLDTHIGAYNTKMGLLDQEDLDIRSDFAEADADALAASLVREGVIQTELTNHKSAYDTKMGELDQEDLDIRADFAAADVAAFSASLIREGAIQTELTNHKSAYDTKMALLDAEDADIRVDFAAADTALHGVISAEIDGDIAAQEVLALADRNAVRSEFAAADTALHGVISAEIDGDIAAQEVLAQADRNAVRSEFAAADTAALSASLIREQAIQTELTNHKSAYDTKMGLLDQEDLDIRSDFATADATLQGNIDTVASDLSAYEGDNDAALQVERARIDAILSGSGVDLDQLVELVAAYEMADNDIISTITTLQGTVATNKSDLSASIAAVASDLESYETSNDLALGNEVSARQTLEGEFDAHVVAYTAKMGALDAEDLQIRSDLSAEIDSDIAAQEILALADRNAVRSEFAAADVAAFSASLIREGAIQTELTNHKSAYDTKMALLDAEDADIRVDFAAADTALHGVISAEIDGDIAAQEVLALADRNAVRDEFAAADAAALSASLIREQAIQSDLDTHKNAYGVKMGLLDAEDIQIRTDFAAADTVLENAIVGVSGDLSAYEASNDLEVANIKADLVSLDSMWQTINIGALTQEFPSGIVVNIVNDLGLQPMSFMVSLTLNGMVLRLGEDYFIDETGTVVTVSVPLMVGDKVSGVCLKSFGLASAAQ